MAGVAVIVALRIVGAVLKHPTTGLAHEISVLELDGTDTRPAAPPAADILVQGDDEVRQREDWPDTVRRRVLVLEDDIGSSADPVATSWRNHTVRLVIAIVARQDAAPKDYLAAKYVEQAVINTLDRQLLSPGKLETAGLRDYFQMDDATQLTSPAIEQDLGNAKILSATRYEFQIRHNHP
jgi:hypothetical protein